MDQATQEPVAADPAQAAQQSTPQQAPVIPAQSTVGDSSAVPADPRDARIAELEAQVARLSTEKATLQDQHNIALVAAHKNLADSLAGAAARYKAVALQLNPELPAELVHGNTIDEIEASFVKAQGIVDRIKAQLTAQAAAQVPAGGQVRGGPDIEGMSALDKIKYSLSTRKK